MEPVHFIRQYLQIKPVYSERQSFDLWPIQETLVRRLDRVIGPDSIEPGIMVKSCRQSGKTTVMAAFVTHRLLFRPNTKILVLTRRTESSVHFMNLVRENLQDIPQWMSPKITTMDRQNIRLQNGCVVNAGPINSPRFQGHMYDFVVMDDTEITSEEASLPLTPHIKQFIATSTPAYRLNWFTRAWETGKLGYDKFRINWTDVPGRDEKWKERMIEVMGPEQFFQEYVIPYPEVQSTP